MGNAGSKHEGSEKYKHTEISNKNKKSFDVFRKAAEAEDEDISKIHKNEEEIASREGIKAFRQHETQKYIMKQQHNIIDQKREQFFELREEIRQKQEEANDQKTNIQKLEGALKRKEEIKALEAKIASFNPNNREKKIKRQKDEIKTLEDQDEYKYRKHWIKERNLMQRPENQ